MRARAYYRTRVEQGAAQREGRERERAARRQGRDTDRFIGPRGHLIGGRGRLMLHQPQLTPPPGTPAQSSYRMVQRWIRFRSAGSLDGNAGRSAVVAKRLASYK